MLRKVFDAMPLSIVTVHIVFIKQEFEKKIYKPLIKYANKSFQLKFQTSDLVHHKDENIIELIPEIKFDYERLQNTFLSKKNYTTVIKLLKQIKGNIYELTFFSHTPGIFNILFNEITKYDLLVENNDKQNQLFDYLIEKSNDALRIIDLDFNKDFFINDNNSLIIRNYFTDLSEIDKAIMEISYEYEDTKKVYLEVHGKRIRYADEKAFMHIVRDITDRATLERKILRKVFETEEKERSRFAKDLHDSLGALLSAVKLKLSVLENENINRQESLKIVKRCKDLITTAVRTTREIANNIRPYEIGDLGLVAAINNLCNQIQIDGKLNIKVLTDNLSGTFDREIEIIVYRIINELINNTIKHSDAKNISIKLFDLFNKLFLVYTDDGKGFDIQKVNSNNMNGMGLKNMINRIKSINGKCEINSSVGSGVEVVIEINLIN